MLYGVGEDGARDNKLLSVATSDLGREMRARGVTIENTLYELELEGRRSLVLPRQIQYRVGQGNVVSCSFLRFSRGTLVDIPLRFLDSEKNTYLRRGGYINRIVGTLKFYVDTFDIPEFIDVSVAEGTRNTVFRAEDVQVPEGLRLKPHKGPGVLAVIQGRSVQKLNLAAEPDSKTAGATSKGATSKGATSKAT